MTRVPLDMLPDEELERLYNAGLVPDEEIERIALARISPRDLAIIDGIAYGIAKLLNTPINQLAAEAASYRAKQPSPDLRPHVATYNKVTQDVARGNLHEPYGMPPWAFPAAEEHEHMSAYPYVGADGQSYPEVASHAVRSLQQQSPSPVYGYLRTGPQQKIYLYPSLDDARGWFVTLAQAQAQPHDYAAVFVATDLSRPVPGLESFGHTFVSGAFVGAASEAELVRRATDEQFFAMYPERHGRKIDPSNPADRALIPVWNDLHQQTAARAQSLALAGDTHVGQFLPFLLGLPLGGLAGYFLRRWQEQHPGHTIPGIPPGKLPAPIIPPPKTSGDWVGGGPWYDIESAAAIGGPWLDIEPMVGGPWYDVESDAVGGPWYDVESDAVGGPWYDVESDAVGGPWLDVEEPAYTIGGPWLDVVGANDDRARMRAWPQTKALIQSAINEVAASANQAPAEAYVWSLDPPNPHLEGAYAASDPFRRPLPPQGTTSVVPFSSPAQALDYMRERIQTPHVALALFDRRSAHWPNPTNWTKSNAAEHEPIIAQQIARSAPPRMAGDYGAPSRWQTTVGAALDDVRTRAQTIANKRAGSVVGVIHTTKDGLWHALAFRNADDADDWLGTATQDPASYTYAAYYDKEDFSWPHPVNEKIGGERTVAQPGQPIRRPPATTSGMR